MNTMAAAMSKVATSLKEVAFTECLPLGRTFSTPEMAKFGEIFNVSEALVAWDTNTGHIVKFIATYIPGKEVGGVGKFHGIMPDGRPAWPQKVEPQLFRSPDGEHEFKERPMLRPAFLDWNKLPAKAGVEFRLLRVYRDDVALAQKSEILDFQIPPPPFPKASDIRGKKERSKVIRRSLTVEDCWEGCPPMALWDNQYHREILKGFSKFSGVPFFNVLALDAALAADGSSPEEISALLADESEETLAAEEDQNILSMEETLAAEEDQNILSMEETISKKKSDHLVISPASLVTNE